MRTFLQGRFIWRLLALVSFICAFYYGDRFWYLLAGIFAAFSIILKSRPSIITEEKSVTESISPENASSENIIVSRVSRRRVR